MLDVQLCIVVASIVCTERERERETIDSNQQSHPALTPPNYRDTSQGVKPGESVRKWLNFVTSKAPVLLNITLLDTSDL